MPSPLPPKSDILPLSLSERESRAEAAARLMKMLANTQRLLILCRLLEGECSVGELSEYVRLAQSATSQHLARMRTEGLVATRRDAQSIYYRLDNEIAAKVLTLLHGIYCGPEHTAR